MKKLSREKIIEAAADNLGASSVYIYIHTLQKMKN